MNKLYDAIESIVIDNELLNKSVKNDKQQKETEISNDHSQLETLCLSFKKIRKIANLVGFNKLTKLQLDNNSIDKIENLSHLVHLTWLDLSFNKIKKIEGLENLTKLSDLSLYSNQIKTLENMDTLTNLQVFSVGKNEIDSLENIQYLRRFNDLAVVIFAGNKVCTNNEYKSFTLSRIKNIKYLDYRLVDDSAIHQAKEQYHEELRDIITKEEAAEKLNSIKRERAARQDLLKSVGLNEIENMFQDDSDNEINKFTFLGAVKEALEDFKEKCKEFIQVFIQQMLSNNQTKEKEAAIFTHASVKVNKAIDNESIKIINDYNSKKKQIQKEARAMKNQADTRRKLEELNEEIKILYDGLMEQEIQLVDQNEEFIRAFESRLAELLNLTMETIRLSFGKLRELEGAFHNTVIASVTTEISKLKNDNDKDGEEEGEKNVLSDKEAALALLNSIHDARLNLIDSKEEEISQNETKTRDFLITKLKDGENKRNTDRISEIYSFITAQQKAAQNLDVEQ